MLELFAVIQYVGVVVLHCFGILAGAGKEIKHPTLAGAALVQHLLSTHIIVILILVCGFESYLLSRAALGISYILADIFYCRFLYCIVSNLIFAETITKLLSCN